MTFKCLKMLNEIQGFSFIFKPGTNLGQLVISLGILPARCLQICLLC